MRLHPHRIARSGDDVAAAFATDRLRMRLIEDHDRDLFCDLYCDPSTMRYIGRAMTRSAAIRSFGTALRLTRRQSVTWQWYAIVQASTGKSLGFCGLSQPRTCAGWFEAGIVLHAAARGAGHGHEAFGGLVRHALRHPEISRIFSRTAPQNAAMIAVLRSLGFAACTSVPHGSCWIRTRRHRKLRSPLNLAGPAERVGMDGDSFAEGDDSWRFSLLRTGSNHMTKLIEFLERMGSDARLRSASGADLAHAMAMAGVDSAARDEILAGNASAHFCGLFAPDEEPAEGDTPPPGEDETPTTPAESGKKKRTVIRRKRGGTKKPARKKKPAPKKKKPAPKKKAPARKKVSTRKKVSKKKKATTRKKASRKK